MAVAAPSLPPPSPWASPSPMFHALARLASKPSPSGAGRCAEPLLSSRLPKTSLSFEKAGRGGSVMWYKEVKRTRFHPYTNGMYRGRDFTHIQMACIEDAISPIYHERTCWETRMNVVRFDSSLSCAARRTYG